MTFVGNRKHFDHRGQPSRESIVIVSCLGKRVEWGFGSHKGSQPETWVRGEIENVKRLTLWVSAVYSLELYDN